MTLPADPTAASDADLVAEARNQNDVAWRELHRRYRLPILGVTYSIVGNPERANDLTQDTFTTASKSLHKLRSDDEFRAWLVGIARHTAYRYLRDRLLDSANSPLVDTPGAIDRKGISAPRPEDTPTPAPAWWPSNADLTEALRQLPPKQRRCIELCYGKKKHSYREISQKTGIPIGTVGSHISRALKTLRKALGPDLDLEEPIR